MLNLFGSSKPDHPMAELKDARRILDEIPANDAFRALDELTHWLESVRTTEGFKPDDRVQLAQLIDEAAQVHARKLQRDYISNPRLSKFQEQRLWGAIHGFWGEVAQLYTACMDLYSSGAKGADAIRNLLPLLTARALRALAAQIKWRYIRYGPFDNSIWASLAKVYALAETRKFTQARVAVYPGSPGESSPEQEFLRVAMLAASSPDSLLPMEMEIAERLIAHFSTSFKLVPEQQPDIAYWIDLAVGHPPLRLARPPQHAPSLRFFAAGKASQELDELIKTIAASGQVPSTIGLGGSYDAGMVLEVLKHLALYWSPKPPERRHPRHRVKSRLNVTPGLQGLHSMLDPSSSLDFNQGHVENWIVDDVSAGGFGATIPQVKGEWLRVGCLVGLQPEGGENWVIGVIRRLNRDTALQGSVGIQSLARIAIPMRLQVQGGSDAESAILLNPAAEALEVQFLLSPGVFVPGQSFQFERNGKTVLLMQASVIERGDDYELLRARQMIQDTSE